MEEALSMTKIISLIEKKNNFPVSFSARKLWMIVHKELPNVGIEEFTLKLQKFSRKDDDDTFNDKISSPLRDETIFEYKIDKNGVREYKIKNLSHEVLKSNEILSKIKHVMCNSNQFEIINPSSSIEDNIQNENSQFVGKNNYMTELEISEKTGIKKERIRPFIVLLIELGIIVIEKSDVSEFNLDAQQKEEVKRIDLSQIESEKNIPKDSCQYPQFKNSNELEQSNSNDFLINSNDFMHFHKLSVYDELLPNETISDKNPKIGTYDKDEIDYYSESLNDQDNISNNNLMEEEDTNENFKKSPKRYGQRRLRWDENQEMRIKNISSTFEYLNNLRSMKKSLISLISKAKDQINSC